MEAYALTDIGQVRSMNQDYIYSSPERVGSLPSLFLVADGMGGHQGASHAFQFFPEERFLIQLSIHNPYPCFQLHHRGSLAFPVKIDYQVLNRKP